jgi:hypothetical protein
MSWNKGSFGFWIVGKSYMRRRDAMQMALLEAQGMRKERERIIKLLIDLNAIRRDALGDLVAFDTYGEKVIYLPGLESK